MRIQAKIAVPASLVVLGAGLPLGAGAAASASAGSPRHAVAARSRSGNANAKLHWVRSQGSNLVEEGSVSGGISGHMRAVLRVGATFSGSFTFYTRGGQIRGHGSATPHGAGRYQSFAGSDVVTGGTGTYAHAHGHGHMYGTFDRKSYAVQIQTRGSISY
jgi:hypothetical protein